MSDKGKILQMSDERLVTLGCELREVIDKFSTEVRVPYASVIGVLRKIEHEMIREWCE